MRFGRIRLENWRNFTHVDVKLKMMLRAQRDRVPRQVLVSTHSSDLLGDEGIAPDEVLLFAPSVEGTTVQVSADIDEVRRQLEAGLTVAEVVIPRTQPENARQMSLFGE